MTNNSHHAVSRNSYSCFTDYENQTIQHHADKLLRLNGIPEHMRDDIMQELAIALWESLPSFDPNKSERKTFASNVIHRKAIDILRKFYSSKERFRREMLSLNVNILCDGEEMEAVQTIPDSTPQVSPELRFDINATIESLEPELREMCLALEKMSLYEYCRDYHVSRFIANRRIGKLRIIFGKLF